MENQCKQCRHEKRCTGSCYYVTTVCPHEEPYLSEKCKNCCALDCGIGCIDGKCDGGLILERVNGKLCIKQ